MSIPRSVLRSCRALTTAVTLACSGALLFSSRLGAQRVEIPASVHVPLFLKLMTFDRQLERRTGWDFVVAIVYQSGFRHSTTTRDEAVRAIAAARHSIEGYTIRAVLIDLDREPLEPALRRVAAVALYVAPLRAADITSIASIARNSNVTTLTGVPGYVADGLSVSVRLKGERPKLLINVASARLEGADFKSELLRLAQVTQ